MSTRRAKQIIYGALYLIIGVGIVYFTYAWFIKPPVSCFDGVKNQNEEGVDCGGVCALTCGLAGVTPITSVGGVTMFTTNPGHFTFLAQVQNHNADFAARSFTYTFNLYSPAGIVIASVPERSFMYANEVKYLVLPNYESSQPIDHANLTVTSPDWVGGSALGVVPQFKFQNLAAGLQGTTVSMSGQISNVDFAAFDKVLVVGIFKDTSGSVVGASQTEVDGLAPNTSQNFAVIYPAVPNIDPSATQVFAYGLRP